MDMDDGHMARNLRYLEQLVYVYRLWPRIL